MADALRANAYMTSLNLESNSISSVGLEAIAEALRTNTSLSELKLANQRATFSQASELTTCHLLLAATCCYLLLEYLLLLATSCHYLPLLADRAFSRASGEKLLATCYLLLLATTCY